jgi:tRNA(Arg) A34 adenosine deaminase TadA
LLNDKKKIKILVGLLLTVLVLVAGLLYVGHTELGISQMDRDFLQQAYLEERKVPPGGFNVGAVVVRNGRIVGRGHSMEHVTGDSRDHAESLAVLDALEYLQVEEFRSNEITVYTTYEPCSMCEGFLIWKNVTRVVCGKKKYPGLNFRTKLVRYLKYLSRLRTIPKESRFDPER